MKAMVRLFDILCYYLVLALPVQWWKGRLAFVLSCAGRYGFEEQNAAGQGREAYPAPACCAENGGRHV